MGAVKKNVLSPRLATAVSFARRGAYFFDIGTDHAQVPIYLAQTGTSLCGVASDVNRGPLAAARENIRAVGLSGRISCVLGNGFCGELGDAEHVDVYVLGMGGELIAEILGNAPVLKDPRVRLILQPMTHAADLRVWLGANGFDVIDERLVRDDGRIYQVICAEYDGKMRDIDAVNAVLGVKNVLRGGEVFVEFARRAAVTCEKKAAALAAAGKDFAEAASLGENIRKAVGENDG